MSNEVFVGVGNNANNLLKNGSLYTSTSNWTINGNNTCIQQDGYIDIKTHNTDAGVWPNFQGLSPAISGNTEATKQIIYFCGKGRSKRTNGSYPKIFVRTNKNNNTSSSVVINAYSIDGKLGTQLNDDEWHTFSAQVQTYNSATGDYYVIKDVDFGIWDETKDDVVSFKEFYCYNLTSVFGRGNEPTKTWCDDNLIPDIFTNEIPGIGQQLAHKVKDISIGINEISRRVKLGYIGVDGKAREFYRKIYLPWTKGVNSYLAYEGHVYGNNKFVALTSYSNVNTVAYSTDGLNWTLANLPVTQYWSPVAFGNNTYVMVNGTGEYKLGSTYYGVYSSNGSSWNSTTIPGGRFFDVTFGNGKFVAVGSDYDIEMLAGVGASYIYSSSGSSWSGGRMPKVNGSAINWISVAYGNNMFVALSQNRDIAYSSSGTSWTLSSYYPSYSGEKIRYINGKFITVCGKYNYPYNKLCYTTDPTKAWTTVTLPVSARWGDIAYGKGLYVLIPNDSNAPTLYSYDLNTWYEDTVHSHNSICFGKDMFVTYYGVLDMKNLTLPIT